MSKAFVIIDVQNLWSEQNPLTAKRINDAANSLRQKMPVIWIYMNRKGFAKAPERVIAGSLKQVFSGLDNGYQPTYNPKVGDYVVRKNDANGFKDTSLRDFLKRQSIDTLYCAGFLSSQCVFSTAAHGALMGFDSHIVMDLTSDYQDKGAIFSHGPHLKPILEDRHFGARVKLLNGRDIGLNL